MRRPLVVGNWKMNGSNTGNVSLLQELISLIPAKMQTEMALCPPFVYVESVAKYLEGHSIACGAQDVSVHIDGAYTGEISTSMLLDTGCKYVIVGHSERRQYHYESNLLVAQKALAALQSGLTPIICVGETIEQRDAGNTLEIIGEQISAVKTVVGDTGIGKSVVAYEPVWAIGTGLTATPEQAQEVHQFIRSQLGSVADGVTLLYGGSVKADNASSLFVQADIDGALVGGASLIANDFIQIALAASNK